MGSRTLLVRHRYTAVAAMLLTGLMLTGCGPDWPVGVVTPRAEAQIADQADQVGSKFAAVVASVPAGQVTEESVSGIAYFILISGEQRAAQTAPPNAKVIYELESSPSAASITVYLATSSTVNSGLYNASAYVYGCATFTANYATEVVTITDEDCPDWVSAWQEGLGADEVSLSELTRDQLGVDTWDID